MMTCSSLRPNGKDERRYELYRDVCPKKAIEAKSKEWQKMITSGAVRVHVGDEAKRLIDMVGVDRLLDSRFVHTTDDGTSTGALKSRWCIRGHQHCHRKGLP